MKFEMKFEDLDLEAARACLRSELERKIAKPSNHIAKEMLKAAIPEVKDWDGLEPLRVNHRVIYRGWEGVVTNIVTHPEQPCPVGCFANQHGAVFAVFINNLKPIKPKPIKPKPIKIDHSSLAGSGIDCVNVYGAIFQPKTVDANSDLYGSIRMNHKMVLTSEQVSLIPDGYDFSVEVVESNLQFLVTVTGTKEGHEL